MAEKRFFFKYLKKTQNNFYFSTLSQKMKQHKLCKKRKRKKEICASSRWSLPPEPARALHRHEGQKPETHANVITRAGLDWSGRI